MLVSGRVILQVLHCLGWWPLKIGRFPPKRKEKVFQRFQPSGAFLAISFREAVSGKDPSSKQPILPPTQGTWLSEGPVGQHVKGKLGVGPL